MKHLFKRLGAVFGLVAATTAAASLPMILSLDQVACAAIDENEKTIADLM